MRQIDSEISVPHVSPARVWLGLITPWLWFIPVLIFLSMGMAMLLHKEHLVDPYAHTAFLVLGWSLVVAELLDLLAVAPLRPFPRLQSSVWVARFLWALAFASIVWLALYVAEVIPAHFSLSWWFYFFLRLAYGVVSGWGLWSYLALTPKAVERNMTRLYDPPSGATNAS
jgi:hypothetical protein